MALSDLNFAEEYHSPTNNIACEFYIPALQEAILYERAVGFFSSSIFSNISLGIEGLVRNHGKIRIVSSPDLSENDIKAISKGYEDREKLHEIVTKSIRREMKPVSEGSFEEERLNMLANLIADGYLDFKIAVLLTERGIGIFHEKLGIITDSDGNYIAFSGSMNESGTAINENYECVEVFLSWKDSDICRVRRKRSHFDLIWNNKESYVECIEFPNLAQEFIDKYFKEKIDYDTFKSKFPVTLSSSRKRQLNPYYPCRPDFPTLYEYQEDAIQNWAEHGYRGIFDMATGTGKTFTGLGALTALSDHLGGKLAVIIVCPFQHLVEQWVEDIEKFNISPIIGHSASTQKNWEKKLDTAIRYQKLDSEQWDFFCFICTNATFALDRVQDKLRKIHGNCLLMIDEAHNFGACNLRKKLPDQFSYRLALSATLERHGDEEGTQVLYDYFGEKCITYSLKRAIAEGKLTRYVYHPVLVALTEQELTNYVTLTKQMLQESRKTKNGNVILTEKGKRIAMKRARLVAGAANKLTVLKEVIQPYTHDTNILVYCGATTTPNYTKEDTLGEYDDSDKRQINVVKDLLGNRLGMRVRQFTSQETMDERKKIKQLFEEEKLQCLVAIKCLDEGVNIPSIRTAFILASTTNPKEYIQRRGRVLRLAKGKNFAHIYDFITLPAPLGESAYLEEEVKNFTLTMVKNEIARAHEFAMLADNFIEVDQELDKIREEYYLVGSDYSLEEVYDYYGDQ